MGSKFSSRKTRFALRQDKVALRESKSASSHCKPALSQNKPASSHCRSAPSQCRSALSQCTPASSQCRPALSQCTPASSQCNPASSRCKPASSQCKSSLRQGKVVFFGAKAAIWLWSRLFPQKLPPLLSLSPAKRLRSLSLSNSQGYARGWHYLAGFAGGLTLFRSTVVNRLFSGEPHDLPRIRLSILFLLP